jgi:hypothetical protein
MKQILSKSLLLIFLVSSSIAYAEMYKGTDSEGNVEYSDEPFSDARQFEAPPIDVVDAPHEKTEEILSEQPPVLDKHAEEHYKNFHIVSPKDGQNIWNDPDLTVSLQLDPPLKYEKKHTIWLLLDGQPLEKNYVNLSIPTGRLDRGTHKLQAEVRDSEGKTLINSNTIIVYIHYSTKSN